MICIKLPAVQIAFSEQLHFVGVGKRTASGDGISLAMSTRDVGSVRRLNACVMIQIAILVKTIW